MKEVRFPGNWDLYCRLPEHRLAWKYLEVSISGSQVWRRNFSADLYYSGNDIWIFHDHSRNSTWRMTKKSPVGAFGKFGKSKWLSFGGWINAIIPILIVPYYSVIGGWVIKYLVEYVKGNTQNLATDGYFLRIYFKWSIHRDLFSGICIIYSRDHLCRCSKWRRACGLNL